MNILKHHAAYITLYLNVKEFSVFFFSRLFLISISKIFCLVIHQTQNVVAKSKIIVYSNN